MAQSSPHKPPALFLSRIGVEVSLLKFAPPDLVTKDGLAELRGIFWEEGQPEISYFALSWNKLNERLSVEIKKTSMASRVLTQLQTALNLQPIETDHHKAQSIVVRWKVTSSDIATVAKRLARLLGVDWQKAIRELDEIHPSATHSNKEQTWYGIPREQIAWFPSIDSSKCDGCRACYEYCTRNVFQIVGEPARAEVTNPLNCIVGCDLCARRCRKNAIEFPPREMLRTFRAF